MAIKVLLKNFPSRVVRAEIVQNSPRKGYRYIGRASTGQEGNEGGFLGFLKNFFGKTINFVGWLINIAWGGISFTFTALWGAVVAATTAIYNFNWNVSDQTLDQQLAATRQILAGQLGATLGNSFGYLACGVLPASAIAVFNEPLGAYLLKEVGEEALEEFCGEFAALLRLSFRSVAQYVFVNFYKNARYAIKRFVGNASPKTKSMIDKIFGGKMTQVIENWGEPNSKPWSFRIVVEETIDNIPNPLIQEFVEEFYEEARDACVEAGYIIARGLDTWFLEQKLAQLQQQGEEALIELQPDGQVEEEKILLYGRGEMLKQQMVSTLSTYRLIDNRDVGQILGEPVQHYLKKNPSPISLRIVLRGRPKPPYIEPNGSRSKQVQITIPNVSRPKIDWQKIKTACGGANGYMWGRFRAKARLKDGNFIFVFASSTQEANDRIMALLELTDSELLTLNVTEIQNEGVRKTRNALKLEPTRVYPSTMTILNQYKVLNEEDGISTPTGTYKRRRSLIDLHTNVEPSNFKEVVNELFRIPGANP